MAVTLAASIKSAVDDATRRLALGRTDTPRLDAEVLMAYVLGWPRPRLLAHWDEGLPEGELSRYSQLVDRRATGEPIAYIRGFKEFLGLQFAVDPRVLIPRPETELLVTTAMEWLDARRPSSVYRIPSGGSKGAQPPLRGLGCPQESFSSSGGVGPSCVVDVGTGSGAIAISLLLAQPSARVIATDVSADALEVARENARRHGVTPEFRQGSLLQPIDEPIDLVVANLPYLSQLEYESLLDTSIGYEPCLALTDGADGLRLFDQLFGQVAERDVACILLEIGSGQPATLQELAHVRLPRYRATVFPDYAGLPRVLQLER